MLYEQTYNRERQPATFYISCVIERITSKPSILLRLRFPQHTTSLFSQDTLYAIEPAHADSSYTVLYRGLYAFLKASQSRQQLILGQRVATVDASDTLRTSISDPHLRDIVLRARQARDYFLLIGPPGTGKTNVALRHLVHEMMDSDGLLLTAFTNRAVDEICSMLTSIGVEFVRLGPELSCGTNYRQTLLSNNVVQHPTRDAMRSRLLNVPVIVGTLASLTSMPELFRLRHFRAAIIDEASQALEPHLLPLLCATDSYGREAIDSFILIGDDKQLPAVVTQSEFESTVASPELRAACITDCRRSLFERLHDLALAQGMSSLIGMLNSQGRMHDDISRYVSVHYYGSQLKTVPLAHQQGPLPYPILNAFPFPELLTQRLLSFDVIAASGQYTAKSNIAEAHCVAQIVRAINLLFSASDVSSVMPLSARLGIIVPFRGQITAIRRALSDADVVNGEDITIDTVERFQGSQRDIIIFSTTICEPGQLSLLSQPIVIGGQPIDRKLNVAITRARQQFILVGNHTLLRGCPPYRTFIEYIEDLKRR